MEINKKHNSTVAVLGASFLIMTALLSFQSTIAGQPVSHNKSASSFSATTPTTSFSGKSIKILFVSSFYDKTDWNNIDSIVSSGYEVKAITPVQEPKGIAYFVVLEAK